MDRDWHPADKAPAACFRVYSCNIIIRSGERRSPMDILVQHVIDGTRIGSTRSLLHVVVVIELDGAIRRRDGAPGAGFTRGTVGVQFSILPGFAGSWGSLTDGLTGHPISLMVWVFGPFGPLCPLGSDSILWVTKFDVLTGPFLGEILGCCRGSCDLMVPHSIAAPEAVR
ncbi:hypothetical protein BO94DRAFT_87230 [Aspergillus sclerotioniger CBS 115572]|uniref:Uncharacterized protein n=1 Tax=Aspergillus sclerotioniger CBS 115572 TaxID=1450535 RepID=A0A317WKJ8_9EURO|nr:hypothetical protein BO94DRAFT_87230 [Aspergillus sclerotioniger CBS 115572]PWY86585.1 hypothetical protein BO94DRAFT_87230 [Aspergillus sclerotioniger CBS 115572]